MLSLVDSLLGCMVGVLSACVYVCVSVGGALQWFLDSIKDEEFLELVGVHSHLGSTIKKVGRSLTGERPSAITHTYI
jgi:hypothetical protein